MKKRVITLLLALLFAFAAFAFAACAEENAGTVGETDTEEGGGTEEPGTDDPSEEEPDPENPGGETGGEEGGGTEEPDPDDPSTEEPDPDDPSEEEPAVTLSFAAAEAEVTRGETYEVTVTLGGAVPAGRVFWYAQDDTVVFSSPYADLGGETAEASGEFYASRAGQTSVAAVFAYFEDGEAKSVTAVCTVRVTELMDYGTAALFAFEDDGETASPALAEGAERITAEYSQNTAQSGTAVSGKAFEVSAAVGNPCLTANLPAGISAFAEGMTVSFWYYTTGGSDWSHIVRTGDHSIRFVNLEAARQNLYPQSGSAADGVGTLYGGASPQVLIEDTGVWNYVSVTLNGDGVLFYKNGELVCSYDSADDTRIAEVCSAFLAALQEGGELVFFGNNEGTGTDYIDDLRLGSYLEEAEVAELYAAVSGQSGEEIPAYDPALYPADPVFDALEGYGMENTGTTTANVHDPSVIEVEENGQSVYYVFSTDNMGPQFGYQVRRSYDLIHWEYVGAAIAGYNENGSQPSEYNPITSSNELYEVYSVLSGDANWQNVYTLWAPDVVPAAGGGYWLYGSWTAGFGQGHSVIFQCYAEEIAGPYEFTDIIVYSYDGWNDTPNAIDPQIYFVGDRMFMAYGSFGGGIWSLELDPATGLRFEESGLKGTDWAALRDGGGTLNGRTYSAAERYGTRLINVNNMEGPTVSYHADVPLYTGDPAEYAESAVTYEDRYYLMGSADSLSATYNMRSFVGTDEGTGAPVFSQQGTRVSGSFSWRQSAGDTRIGFDFGYPGHNDMLTTSGGVDLIVYHDRISFDSGNRNHYLFASMYAFDSLGRLVISPNRYAGEALRTVSPSEVWSAGGGYSFAYVTDNSYASSYNSGYAMQGLRLLSDGNMYYGGLYVGEWVLYGDNWVYLNISVPIAAAGGGQTLSGEFYGVAFPTYIEAEGAGGLSLSLLSENGQNALYLNMVL